MNQMDANTKANTEASGMKAEFKAILLERLQNPTQFKALVTSLVLFVGYVGIYMPLSSGMEEKTRKLAQERTHLGLARDVEYLQAQFDKFKDRLPEKRDPNEWVSYVLDGIRKFPLKLAKLDAESSREVGPYKAVVLRIEFEGAFADMDGFLYWLESNERLFRVDTLKIAPHRSGDGKLVMQLVVLGVMG